MFRPSACISQLNFYQSTDVSTHFWCSFVGCSHSFKKTTRHDSTSELPEVFRYLPLQGQLHPLFCDGDAGCDSYLWGDHLQNFKRLETSSKVSQKSTFLWRSTSCVIESYACPPKPQENLLDQVTWIEIELKKQINTDLVTSGMLQEINSYTTPSKTNRDWFGKGVPFQYGHFWYACSISGGNTIFVSNTSMMQIFSKTEARFSGIPITRTKSCTSVA